MAAKSKDKDSTTGHWEFFGLITEKEFPTYPNGFSEELIETFLQETGYKGILGNKAASANRISDSIYLSRLSFSDCCARGNNSAEAIIRNL